MRKRLVTTILLIKHVNLMANMRTAVPVILIIVAVLVGCRTTNKVSHPDAEYLQAALVFEETPNPSDQQIQFLLQYCLKAKAPGGLVPRIKGALYWRPGLGVGPTLPRRYLSLGLELVENREELTRLNSMMGSVAMEVLNVKEFSYGRDYVVPSGDLEGDKKRLRAFWTKWLDEHIKADEPQ